MCKKILVYLKLLSVDAEVTLLQFLKNVFSIDLGLIYSINGIAITQTIFPCMFFVCVVIYCGLCGRSWVWQAAHPPSPPMNEPLLEPKTWSTHVFRANFPIPFLKYMLKKQILSFMPPFI